MALSYDALADFIQNRMGLDLSGIQQETPLFSSGLLDSFSMVELIMFIEEQSGSRISPADVNMENLDSIDRILRFTARA